MARGARFTDNFTISQRPMKKFKFIEEIAPLHRGDNAMIRCFPVINPYNDLPTIGEVVQVGELKGAVAGVEKQAINRDDWSGIPITLGLIINNTTNDR